MTNIKVLITMLVFSFF